MNMNDISAGYAECRMSLIISGKSDWKTELFTVSEERDDNSVLLIFKHHGHVSFLFSPQLLLFLFQIAL